MRAFFLAATILASSCASLQQETPMAFLSIVWSVKITPLILEETQNPLIISAAAEVQAALDSGDPSRLLDVSTAWQDVLKQVVESQIQAQVDAGKISSSDAVLLREAVRQFELRLGRLLV